MIVATAGKLGVGHTALAPVPAAALPFTLRRRAEDAGVGAPLDRPDPP